MPETLPSVLIVADDRELARRLAAVVLRLGYGQTSVLPLTGAERTIVDGSVGSSGVTILALSNVSDSMIGIVRTIAGRSPARALVAAVAVSGDEAVKAMSALTPLLPVVEVSEEPALAVAMRSALQASRATAADRRRVWELQILNEIAEVISRSLELEDVLTGALERLLPALDAAGGSIRLLNETTGEYETKADLGPAGVAAVFEGIASSTERVIVTRCPSVIDDLAAEAPHGAHVSLPVRSTISVPMLVKDELVGTLSIASVEPYRFERADEHLLRIIAGQIGVAVQNARLHDVVRRGKQEWEHTFDAISDAMAVFDSRGRLLRGNSALASLLGRPVTDLPRSTCHSVGFCVGSFPRCAVGEAAVHGAAGRFEVTLSTGEIFSVTTFPILGHGDGPSVVQVAKNVTEEIRSARRLRQMSEELGSANGRLTATVDQLKSTQAQLLQSEKLSAIGQLVAGVAHELNNPLTSVIGYAQLLEEELREARSPKDVRRPSELAQDLRRIVDESERAARIVRNLLAFARRQTAARASHDIAELVTRVLSLRAYDLRLNSIELKTAYEPGLPPVVADAGQIQQALLNLILNAEQAMRGRATRRLTVAARFDEPSSAVQLSVTDTGHGIDDASLTRIFDPFFTTRDVGDGTGLGLSICYGIVRDHGGQILVDSRVQVGSTFSILLPAKPDEPAPAAEPILVSHPDQGERDFISAALLAWGYKVASTAEPLEALKKYRAGGLQDVRVDRGVIATDLMGWSGARATDARQTPLVLLSRAADESEIDRFGREHASAVLAPPFQLRVLRSVIRAVAKEYV
jgi:signal transduction histidine kinase/CheY-like chemotaxis protein